MHKKRFLLIIITLLLFIVAVTGIVYRGKIKRIIYCACKF